MNQRIMRMCDFALSCLDQRMYDARKRYQEKIEAEYKAENNTATAINITAMEFERECEMIKQQKEEVLEMRDFLYKNEIATK